ncbi:MAG TPA: lysylphosphatidylglycerol synthase transmembrane domain-containing protein, partial [Planctomycetota bacterium]|nr:lysylphosphatidylglycerol synthase transmembrane domain-containing protein [Planctomycetota bacterium]
AIGNAADYSRLLEVMGQGNKAWLAGCLAGELLAYTGYVLAYRDLARVAGGPELPYPTVVRVTVASFGATVLGAAAGGQALNYWALRRAHAGRHEAVSRVLALNTLEWAVLGVATALAALAALLGLAGNVDPVVSIPWLVVVPVALAGAVFVSSPRRARRLTAVPLEGHRVARGLRLALADAVAGLVLIRRLLSRPLAYPAGVFGYPLRWLGDIFCLWSALQAFGAELPPAALLLGYTSGYVATALPLPAGGAGGIDASLTYALYLVGLPLAPALLGVFVYRAFSFWLELGIAVALLPTLRRLREQLAGTSRGEPAPARDGAR